MKKKYEKPGLIYESFELNQTVAQTCGAGDVGNTNHYNRNTCGYIVDDIIIWVGDDMENGCNDDTDPDAEVYGYCYNTPTPDMQIFSS